MINDLFENIIALNSKNYLKSIKRARQEYKEGKIHTFRQIFGQKQ